MQHPEYSIKSILVLSAEWYVIVLLHSSKICGVISFNPKLVLYTYTQLAFVNFCYKLCPYIPFALPETISFPIRSCFVLPAFDATCGAVNPYTRPHKPHSHAKRTWSTGEGGCVCGREGGVLAVGVQIMNHSVKLGVVLAALYLWLALSIPLSIYSTPSKRSRRLTCWAWYQLKPNVGRVFFPL